MNTLRKIVLTVGFIALGSAVSGCTAFKKFSEIDALNEAQAVGNPFTQSLTGEYRAFANSELESTLDYPDALHFARKGLAAASGESVLPEPVSDWNVSETNSQELGAGRGRLIVAYDLGGREVAPALAARTQAKFDCWIEQQEENWNGTPPCKGEFFQALEQLEGQLGPIPAEPIVEADPFAIDASQPLAAENAVYLVFFNWDSSQLSSGALNVLDAVAEEVAKNPPQSIDLVGHADTSGASDYNTRLAIKRVNKVKSALIERGVPAGILRTDARGENELLVATPDGVREPANRRVNISFN